MSTVLAAIAGAVVGAAVSVAANLFVLPRVIGQRKARTANFGSGEEQMITRIYRYAMPPCFVGVFAVASAFQFGEIA